MSGLEMRYFVLKPRGATPYAKASRAAMRQYAKLIMDTDQKLAKSLQEWALLEQERVSHPDDLS